VRSLFRSDRLIASVNVQRLQVGDTLDFSIPNSVVLAKILSERRRLRIGIRVRSDSTVRIIVHSANTGLFPRLRYDPAADNENINVFERPPRSFTPVDDPTLAADFTDYTIPVGGAFPLQKSALGGDTASVYRDSVLALGGVAGRRAYFRFNIPDSVLDASIVRATLILNQKSASDYGSRDTLSIVPQAVFAKATVPVSRAALLNDSLRIFLMPSVRREARDAGVVRFDVVGFARTWSSDTKDEIPFALTLRVGQEGRVIQEMLFYSTSGPPALRPKLRITFVPRVQSGPP
jgi:hypothetical protein